MEAHNIDYIASNSRINMDSGYRKPITMVTRQADIPIRDLMKRKQCINYTTLMLNSKAKQMKRIETVLQGRSAGNKYVRPQSSTSRI
jgi:hypothetical protein